ncbi:hypothetical protein [Larkinella harenae]
MAYKFNDGDVFYPYRQSETGSNLRWDALCIDKNHGLKEIAVSAAYINRAPEHDLVPIAESRAVVDELVKITESVSNSLYTMALTTAGIETDLSKFLAIQSGLLKQALAKMEKRNEE